MGAYAYSIVCDAFRVKRGHYFRAEVNCSHDAETMCIGNALYELLQDNRLTRANLVVVNTDCMVAINRLEACTKHHGVTAQVKLIETVLKKKLKCRIEYRHVKAHNGTPDSRSWQNDWCDKEAKKWRKRKETLLLVHRVTA